jgi:cytoskeletal protein CcmA (bactofilin family)
MANTVFQSPKIRVRVKNDGAIAPTQPLTLKNAIGTGRRIDELTDVALSNVGNAHVLAYNSESSSWVNHPATTLTGNTFQIAVANATNDFDWRISLPNNVIIANSLNVGDGFVVGGNIVSNGNLFVTGFANIAGPINRNPTIAINLTGDVIGTGNTTLIDLSNGVINIVTSNQPNSIELGVDTSGAYVGNVFAGTGMHIDAAGGENSNPTFYIGQPVETTSDVVFNSVTANAFANVAGSLRVTGNSDFSDAGFSGSIRVGTNATIVGHASVNGTATFNGATTIANTLAVGNVSITGFVHATSDAFIHGQLTANGSAFFANTVSVTGVVDLANTLITRDVVPFANNQYSLGTSSMRFTELYLSGNTLVVGNAVITDTGTSLSAQTPTGDPITVDVGNTTIQGTLSVVQTITSNNLVANTLNVGEAADLYGDIRIHGTTVANGSVSVANTIATGNATVVGFINVSSTANIGGNITARGQIVANGSVTIANTLAAGNTTIVGFVEITSTANIGGNVAAHGSLIVDGPTNITNTLAVGNTTITGTANVQGNVVVTDTITGNNLTLSGNLNVSGTTTYINTTQLNVGDNIISLNADMSGAPTENAGIDINRGTGANVQFMWDESNDRWSTNGSNLAVGANVVINTTDITVGNSTVNTFANSTTIVANNINVATINRNPNITVTLTGDVIGTANTTLTNLANGSITLSTTIQPNAVELGVDTSGSYVGNVVPGTGVYVTNAGGENSTPTIAIGQPVDTTSAVTFGNTTLNGFANVSGKVTAGTIDSGNVSVTGYINVSSTANIGGNITARGSVTVNGSVLVANSMSAGNTTVDGFANVIGNLNAITATVGNTAVAGTLSAGNTTVSGYTYVTGYINVASTANVGGAVTLRDSLTVNGAVLISNTLSSGNTTIAGFANVVNSLNVVGGTTLANTVTIDGNTTITAGEFVLSNTVSKWINFQAAGIGAPTTTTRSVGTKAVLWNTVAPTAVDYAIGIESQAMWFSTATLADSNFKFYANTTLILQANNTGLSLFDRTLSGVTTLAAGNTTISGYANVAGNIQATTLLAGNTTIAGTLGSGNTTISGYANVTTNLQTSTFVAGNSTITGFANVIGNIQTTTLASGNATVTGFANVVGSLQTTTLASGNAVVAGTLTSGNSTITGFANVVGSLQSSAFTSGNTTINGTVAAGNTTIDGTVAAGDTTITGFANVVGTLQATTLTVGNTTIAGTVAAGNTSITGSIDVSSTANVGGNVDVHGGLTVNGAAVVANTLSTGNTTITGFANVTGSIAANTIAVANYIDFSNTAPVPSKKEGRLYYDAPTKTLAYHVAEPDVTMNIGQELWTYVYNNSGALLDEGRVVYQTGALDGVPTAAYADASDPSKLDVIGVTTHPIEDGSYGYATSFGRVTPVNTAAFSINDKLYLDYASPGGLTLTPPTYPNYAVHVGHVAVVGNSSVGSLRVDIDSQAFPTLRTEGDARIGGDLIVEGNFTITGNVTSTAVNNLSVEDNFIYIGAGDTISNTNFTGIGLNDALFHGVFEGSATTHYYVKITAVGATDKFSWSKDNFATTEATDVLITGAPQALDNGITIEFQATTGHMLLDVWDGVAAPVNVDLGIVGNYNTGTYAHTGLFRDATDGAYKFFEGYTPEPTSNVNIDTAHASFALANVVANTFFGNLTGTAANATLFNGQSAGFYTSNAYANATFAQLAGATFVGAVIVGNTLSSGNTTITGFANVVGSLQSTTLSVGNTTIIGTLASGNTTVAGTLGAGNTTIVGFANVSSTLAAGNTTITGFANVSGTLGAGNTTITGFANVSGDVVVSGNITTTAITLTNDLTVPNGGTGRSTFTLNGVLYGNDADGLLVTAAGVEGEVLQIIGGVPTFGSIDCGTF